MKKPLRVHLPLGESTISFSLPDSTTILNTLEPPVRLNKKDFLQGLHQVLPKKNIRGEVAVIVADKTRLCGYDFALFWLMEALTARGVEDNQVTFYIAYGTHKKQKEEECVAAYGASYKRYRFIHHDCVSSDMVLLGTTTRGTRPRIRKDVLQSELIITFGAVSHHYFAGFGGGRKLLFPGLAGKEGIYHNHSLFLDKQQNRLAAGCRTGKLEGNPLAEDLQEINRMLPPYISIHGLLNSKGQVVDYCFGGSYEDFLTVCKKQDQLYRAVDRKQYDLIIGSAGGYPKDINFIQTHKALHNCSQFVRDKGTLILLAECREQVGSSSFLPYFKMGGFKKAFAHLVDNYEGNGGTALAMMEKNQRITISMVTSLDKEVCGTIGIEPIPVEEVEKILTTGTGDIGVIPNGSMLV